MSSLKHVRDGIADAFWPDKPQAIRDSHDGVTWHYAQESAKIQGIRITLAEYEDCECHFSNPKYSIARQSSQKSKTQEEQPQEYQS